MLIRLNDVFVVITKISIDRKNVNRIIRLSRKFLIFYCTTKGLCTYCEIIFSTTDVQYN